jgi:tetratricopeptide (TPR) repeat protein
MIEVLLEAERALSMGMLEQAERLYWQAVESDRRNVIAIVGLARVALERGDDRTALEFGRKALELDPENGAAARLVERVEGLAALRAASTATVASPERRAPDSREAPVAQPAPPAESIEWPAADLRQPIRAASDAPPSPPPAEPEPWPAPSSASSPMPPPATTEAAPERRPGLFDRFRRNR